MPAEPFRPEQFLEAVDAANRWIASAGGRHTFIGGFAVAFVALPRVTQDIDAVVLLNEERLDEFLALGEQFGFAGREADTLEFALRYRVFKLVHLPSGVPFDLSLAGTDFEIQAIEHASEVDLGGVRFPIPTPTDLVVMKAFAGRLGDLHDIYEILRLHPDVDLSTVRMRLVGLADLLGDDRVVRDFDEIVHRHQHRPNNP